MGKVFKPNCFFSSTPICKLNAGHTGRISLLGVFVLVVVTVDTLNHENMLFRPFLSISSGLLSAGYHC